MKTRKLFYFILFGAVFIESLFAISNALETAGSKKNLPYSKSLNFETNIFNQKRDEKEVLIEDMKISKVLFSKYDSIEGDFLIKTVEIECKNRKTKERFSIYMESLPIKAKSESVKCSFVEICECEFYTWDVEHPADSVFLQKISKILNKIR